MGKGIISFLFIAVAVAVFVVWTRPQLHHVQELRAQKDAVNKVLADSQELQKLRDKLLSQYNSIPADDLVRLSRAFPKTAEETKLMVEFSDIADANGVILGSFQTKTRSLSSSLPNISRQPSPAAVKPYREVDITISFSASYEALVSFIKTIESSLRLIDVKKIDFSASDKDSYEVKLTATAYYQTH